MKISVYCVVAASAVLLILTPLSSADRVDDLVEQGQEAAKNGYNRGNNREAETIDVIQNACNKNIDDNVFPEATNNLRRASQSGVRLLGVSEDAIKRGIDAAKIVVLQSPEAAKIITNNAIEEALRALFASGNYFLKSSGISVALSTNASRPGLESSCKLILKAGFAVNNALTATQILVNQGIDAGGKANQLLLDAAYPAARIGYEIAYGNNQMAIREATQTLRNAQNAPQMQQLMENGNCILAQEDSEASEALKVIDESADKAFKRGANAALVKQFKLVLKCALGDYVAAIGKIEQKIEDIRQNQDSDPLAARQSFFKQAEMSKEKIFDITARIYSYLGEGAQKTGNQSNPKVDEAITAIEAGKVQVFSGIDTSGELIVFAKRHDGDAFELAFNAASRSTMYAKRAFIETIESFARTVFGSVF